MPICPQKKNLVKKSEIITLSKKNFKAFFLRNQQSRYQLPKKKKDKALSILKKKTEFKKIKQNKKETSNFYCHFQTNFFTSQKIC